VVLVPGYRASRDSLLPVADRLHGAGWRVTLMDPRGVGGSAGHRSTLGWRESQDVAAFVGLAQERTLGPVVLYGFSAGAAAALRSVALGQSIAEAVIAEACFDTMRTALDTRVRHIGAPTFPIVDLLLFWSWFDQEVPGWRHNPVDYAAQVRSPLLVLQGADDWRAPPARARDIAKAAPQGVFALLDGTGHQPGVLTRPLAWERAVEGFLMEAVGPADTSAPVPEGDDGIPPPPDAG
jgi:pimeloyl-ACP methyl ester carboxylesterase